VPDAALPNSRDATSEFRVRYHAVDSSRGHPQSADPPSRGHLRNRWSAGSWARVGHGHCPPSLARAGPRRPRPRPAHRRPRWAPRRHLTQTDAAGGPSRAELLSVGRRQVVDRPARPERRAPRSWLDLRSVTGTARRRRCQHVKRGARVRQAGLSRRDYWRPYKQQDEPSPGTMRDRIAPGQRHEAAPDGLGKPGDSEPHDLRGHERDPAARHRKGDLRPAHRVDPPAHRDRKIRHDGRPQIGGAPPGCRHRSRALAGMSSGRRRLV
jgi:hypothetical protein